jgi:hypothetical protein
MNNTMDTGAKILIGGLLGLGAVTSPVVYNEVQKALPISEATTIERIETLQSGKQKFEQLSKEQVQDRIGKTPYETEVHEYVGAKGNGSIVIFHDTIEVPATTTKGTVQITRTKSVGYGTEAEHFTHDWQ